MHPPWSPPQRPRRSRRPGEGCGSARLEGRREAGPGRRRRPPPGTRATRGRARPPAAMTAHITPRAPAR
ncbi:hypothetical protein CYJ23_07480 [Actinomyces oris]|nr:hypothetical protein CYJ23_07480 [Actinomyces oris]